MHLAKVYSAQTDLANSHIIEVEVDIAHSSMPGFAIVGLPDKAVEEARERVNAAIKNSMPYLDNFEPPKSNKTVASLSPADVPKSGPVFDLPIALAYLLAHGESEVDFDPQGKVFLGELSLDGRIKPITGTLPLVAYAKSAGFTSVYVPTANAAEAALVSGIHVFAVDSLRQLLDHLAQESATKRNPTYIIPPTAPTSPSDNNTTASVDFADVVDQDQVKRALTIAAAGGHNIAMYGPPGTGKTMMAKAFAGILPPLDEDQTIAATSIHSYVGVLDNNQPITIPPFRAPHHTSSYVSVVGGGTYPKPGEISLAHHGVLFLDEFPEFDRRVLESLREPLEDKVVRVARSKGTLTFPADFILVAALNPPSETTKHVTPAERMRFERKLTGPIMDRVDIWIEVPKVEHAKLLDQTKSTGPSSADIRAQVVAARSQAQNRQGRLNNALSVKDLDQHIRLDQSTKDILDQAATNLRLSPRAYHKVVKLARTIADLDQAVDISQDHILEALQYRPKDIV